MPGKKVLVLGGGFGGAKAAITSRALLPPDHEVTLIDRNRRTFICGGFPMLIVGERAVDKLSRSLGRLANRGVRYVQADVTRIDTLGCTLKTTRGVFEYDYLVVAAGAEYDWSAVPGSKSAYSFYGLDEARKLRRKLRTFRRGRVVVAVSSLPYKCPPAPFEAALLLNWSFRRSGVRKAVDIHVYTPEPAPLAVAGPEATRQIADALSSRGVTLHTGAAVKEVSKDGRAAMFTDGSTLDADVVITIPVHKTPGAIAESGLTGGKPWTPVNAATLETSFPSVFAVGDVNVVPMANGRPMPKAGVFASGEGETAARIIASRIVGTEPPPPYSGEGLCFLAYSGTQSGSVSGSFLASGAPKVEFKGATAAGMRGKERFERDWRRFKV